MMTIGKRGGADYLVADTNDAKLAYSQNVPGFIVQTRHGEVFPVKTQSALKFRYWNEEEAEPFRDADLFRRIRESGLPIESD